MISQKRLINYFSKKKKLYTLSSIFEKFIKFYSKISGCSPDLSTIKLYIIIYFQSNLTHSEIIYAISSELCK